MSDDDPISEGHDAAVQVATIGSTLLGELSRRAATRTRDRADAAAHQDTVDRSRRAATEARAAARWAPILDRDYRAHATTREALDAWFAAEPRSTANPQAARAAALSETRLRQTAPGMMADYDAERGLGTDRLEAMQQVVPVLDVAIGDRDRTLDALAGTLVNRARTEEATADRLRATPDDTATRHVDEHRVGLAAALTTEAVGASDRAAAAVTTVTAAAPARPGTPDFPAVITTVRVRTTPPVGAVPGPSASSATVPVLGRKR